jgi:hypothetical protein
MSNDRMLGPKRMLLTCFLVGMLASPALNQTVQSKEKSGTPAVASTTPAAVPHAAAVPSIATAVPSGRQATMLRRLWGIDDIHLRAVASGSLIRFSYRVVDADKAKILNDKKVTPYLIDQKNGLALQIPQLEQVGQLRQVSTPQNGREYWMAFSNKGRTVKPGDHVTVIIGRFRVEELVVEASSAPQLP